MSGSSHAATDIPVKAFRQIFQWPLVFQPGKTTRTNHMDTIAGQLGGGPWKPVSPRAVTDGTEAAPTPGQRDVYASFVYFHDFVQSFLFPKQTDDHNYRIWHRDDVRTLSVDLFLDGQVKTFEFEVIACEMHVFGVGVAMLSLEVALTQPATLAEVQTLIDRVRRTYVPFWHPQKSGGHAGRCAQEIRLTFRDGMVLLARPHKQAKAVAHFNKHGDAPIFAHWKRLIEPLEIGNGPGKWRDPSDERAPCMSYISLTDASQVSDECSYRKVSEGDWLRLADAEEAGTSPYPYNRAFLKPYEDTAYYDRFVPDKTMNFAATRHIFGGMHFASVGAGDEFDKMVLDHFRNHYMRLGLIVRFEMAALLAFSSRLTEAVRRRDNGGTSPQDETAFETEVLTIQRDFLTFTHRFHFTGVTSQTQGAEMFAKWRASVELDELFEDVKRELDDAATAVRSAQTAREATDARRLADVATWGVGLGLILGALGLNVFVGLGKDMEPLLASWGQPMQALLVTTIGLFVMALFFCHAKRKVPSRSTAVAGVICVIVMVIVRLTG